MKVHTAMRWIISAATIILISMLILQCLDIYHDGNHESNLDDYGMYIQNVYRPEDVAHRLLGLRIWAVSYLFLLCCASFFLPAFNSEKKHGLVPDNRLRLLKRNKKLLPEEAVNQEVFRRKICIAASISVCVFSAVSLIYLLNGENFSSWELEATMGQILLHVGPWIILSFATLIVAVRMCRQSVLKEISILEGLPTEKVITKVPVKGSNLAFIRFILYFVAIVLILLGIYNGGMQDVLLKAVNICTECIGLG